MDSYEIVNIYGRDGRERVLSAYAEAIEEAGGSEERMNELAFLAADYSHADALKLLFENGASPAATDRYGFTLLHYLARRPQSTYYVRPTGAVADTTALLLDHKVSVLRKDENENMACYHYAARNGLAEMVEALAERGAKLSMTDRDGNTGIHIACDYVQHALRDIGYKEKQLKNQRAQYEETVAQLKAREMTDEEIAEYVRRHMGTTPEQAEAEYSEAVQRVEDYFRLVKAFAEGGVDIDEKNDYGQTALDIAVKSDAKKLAAYLSGALADGDDEAAVLAGGMTLHQAAEKGDAAAIEAIAGRGADLNGLKDGAAHPMGGCTPLSVACAFLQVGAVDALLACGADPSFRDGTGRAAVSYMLTHSATSLDLTAFKENRISNIIKSLVSAGMDINMPVNDDSDTLLISACKSRRGTLYNNRSLKGDVIQAALKLSPDMNAANLLGETALMFTCVRDFDIMENVQLTLLEQGADVAAVDQNGDSALHYAARNDTKTGVKVLCDMLLEFGADAHAVNNAGQTALDIAAETDNEPLVKLLLSKM